MIDIVLVVCLTVILSVMPRFAYLNRPDFPTFSESETMGVVRKYEQGYEFDPDKPPLGYFAYWVTQKISLRSDSMRRLFPATFSALVPPVLTCAMLFSGLSSASSFAIGIFVALESSFCVAGRECAGNSLFDLFAVLTLACFLVIERRGKCDSLLVLESVFLSLALCTDSCGLILLFHILAVVLLKNHKNRTELLERVRYLAIVTLPMSFFIILVHISLLSGPSDVYPFRTRFVRVLGSILRPSQPENILPLLVRMNPVALAFAVIGIVWALIARKFELVPAFFLSLLSMFYSTSSFVLKAHLMMLSGIISAFTLVEQADTHRLRPVTMVSVCALVLAFVLQFFSQM